MARRKRVEGRSSLFAIGTMTAAVTILLVADYRSGQEPELSVPVAAAAIAAAPAPVAAPVVQPVVEPAVTPELEATETVMKTEYDIDASERERLAAELRSWKTRDPRQLVDVIADLAERKPLPLPPTYLLAIAWSETRGKILAVSPAGAAGLAQATPAAYLSEGFDGKVFMTNSYLIGSRAYIMKKPLGDALSISEMLLEKNTPARRAEAKKLLARAMELRREGMDELEALRPVANDIFYERIADADERNLAILQELGRIIDQGARRTTLQRFHGRVEKDYRYLRNLQRDGWKRYEIALTKKRDALLREHFDKDPDVIFVTNAYEAGEYLGRVLDARFSPTHMADFLAVHLATKQREAIALGFPEEKIDEWTAALYNGGAVNVKRMNAGLMDSLRETEKYMQSVPRRSGILARAIG
ncbi:MAG: hypothetical protein ACRD2J_03095 [Thermoanaerobaculia bacterium]